MNVNFNFFDWIRPPAKEHLLDEILKILMRLSMDIQTLTAKVNAVSDQLDKAKIEITTQIQALRDALTDVQVPPEAEAALTRLEGLAQALDDFNPDAPAVEPESEAPAEPE